MKSGHRISIPNFIFSQISFICNGFLVYGMSFRTNSAPIFCVTPFLRNGFALLKLTDGIGQRIIGDVDITVHGCFDTRMSE